MVSALPESPNKLSPSLTLVYREIVLLVRSNMLKNENYRLFPSYISMMF